MNPSRAYTFGSSRIQMKNVAVREMPPIEPDNPGPGSYAIANSIGKEGSKLIMKSEPRAGLIIRII